MSICWWSVTGAKVTNITQLNIYNSERINYLEWMVAADLQISKICSQPNLRFVYKWTRGEKTSDGAFDAPGMSGEFHFSPAKTRKVHPVTGQLRQLSDKQRKRKSHSLGVALNPDELRRAFEAEEELIQQQNSPRGFKLTETHVVASPRGDNAPPLVRRKASKRSALIGTQKLRISHSNEITLYLHGHLQYLSWTQICFNRCHVRARWPVPSVRR